MFKKVEIDEKVFFPRRYVFKVFYFLQLKRQETSVISLLSQSSQVAEQPTASLKFDLFRDDFMVYWIW